ncbi:MAG: hypothetical protein KIS92_03715 [Planctomycetota bacterium]|nr:hypothetical protein [Planctomycetota bacterium]
MEESEFKLTKAGKAIVALVFLAILGIFLSWTCTEQIAANQVGVRTKLTSEGVEKVDYGPGFILAVPGFHIVRKWDPTWFNLKDTLQVRGSDQYTTTVDISVMWRISPGRCNEVAMNFRDEEHIEQLVKNTLNKYANEILAQMKTEDFYNTSVRNKKSDEAQKAMDEQLQPVGVEVRHLLLRNIVYDPKFEKQLLQKQLAGQRKSLETAKGQMAAAQTQTELIKRNAEAEVKRIEESRRQEIENLTADADRKIGQIIQDAKLQSTEVLAKAQSIRRQKLAQAELVKATAMAKGTEMLSKVYERPGAKFYFARQALEGMKLGEIEVNSSDFNPLDSERLLRALGLEMRAPAPVGHEPGGE